MITKPYRHLKPGSRPLLRFDGYFVAGCFWLGSKGATKKKRPYFPWVILVGEIRDSYTWQPLGPLLKVKLFVGYMRDKANLRCAQYNGL